MSHAAEFIQLEYSLQLSQATSQWLLKFEKKTPADIAKILWECRQQMKLIADFAQTEAHYQLGNDQQYLLHQQHIEAENTHHDLSKE